MFSFLNISNIIYQYHQLLVAFSGGLDSTVLLHWLTLWRNKRSDIKLRAIHVHHGLSKNADSWATHCQLICAEWKIPLLIEYVKLANNRLGTEGQAREARYAIFKKSLLSNEVLVTAQHLNDQSETFLLALKRGSGPAGLSAMPIKKLFANTQILRPLLNEKRASILNWAKKHNLHWIKDESNYDDIYDRNFLRLNVLPLLTKRWPYFVKAIARSASLCAEQESLIDELLANDLASVITNDGNLIIAPLIDMSSQRRSALIRRWIASKNLLMPSRTMLDRIWHEVAQAREDSSPFIHMNGYIVRRFRRQLWLVKKYQSLQETIINWTDFYNTLTLPKGMGYINLITPGNIRLPLPNELVSIRFKASGKIYIIGRNGGRKLKKIWQEYNVPPWLRSNTPLLFYNEILIAAAGIFITKDGWIEKGGIQLEWKI